ncbi:uncharacterized protein H6S33_011022 [Morchella sextelata]|uniref:uncharacterized protein n=1 Tax=Morchella sextelata TaxID=1174677 RepID=UPI001D049D19|nr:uncharacterized protein H6S33_011022 [Morchella sextelata]KAH0611757.1 hypothetical protein H6S33_011022 [Morchella sextelata]
MSNAVWGKEYLLYRYDCLRSTILVQSIVLHQSLLSMMTSHETADENDEILLIAARQSALNLTLEAFHSLIKWIDGGYGTRTIPEHRKEKTLSALLREVAIKRLKAKLKRVKGDLKRQCGVVFDTESAVPGRRPSRLWFGMR